MGCGSSKTKDSYSKPSASGGKGSAKQTEEIPDPGLYSTHRAVKSLGKGGTGETWLYQDRVTGQEVAVKLMRRPLPKVIEPNIQREIRVRPLAVLPREHCSPFHSLLDLQDLLSAAVSFPVSSA